jgi:4-oxalomesaconate tautomerase
MSPVRCALVRGGTSRGAYFLAADLPEDPFSRNELLLRVMGTPFPLQADGIGGGHPLTSKVAIVSPASRPDADVDYLFLQVGVDQPTVTDRQNCGNLLAGIGPFARRRGLVDHSPVRIHMVNTGEVATATFPADAEPGSTTTVVLEFARTGALLPTGNVRDVIGGVEVTCVDNGMPVVVVAAKELGRTGYESVAELEADEELRDRVQALRLAAGALMGLGDVRAATVPKVTLTAPPRDGGTICTRTFIPVRVHEAIGVLGAVSVATALVLDGATSPGQTSFDIEHPTGHMQVEVELDTAQHPPTVIRAGVVRTTRLLFDGVVFPRET